MYKFNQEKVIHKQIAAKKSACPSEDGSAGEFKGGMPSRPSVKIEAAPAALLVRAEHRKKFSFPFRRKKSARANREKQRKLFVGRAGFRHGGGAASLGVFFKVGLSKVQNFPQKPLFSSSPVEGLMDFAKLFIGQMSVNLSGRNITVP